MNAEELKKARAIAALLLEGGEYVKLREIQ